MDSTKINISATIVLYKEDKTILQKTINSFLATPLLKKLFLIDNSSHNNLSSLANHPDIEYISTKRNVGFGAAHNKVIEKIENSSDFHLILNPDVSFKENVILDLIERLKTQKDVAMIAPKVVFPNQRHQYTARKYPSFFDLIIRRLKILDQRIYEQEYRNKDLSKPFFVEYLTGCFQLYRTEDFVALNGFDERYFLYMEDVDICKKIDAMGKKKLYFPKETITHVLKQGSSKSLKLFFYHLTSAIKYFLKWR